jgi:hypothetical protein
LVSQIIALQKKFQQVFAAVEDAPGTSGYSPLKLEISGLRDKVTSIEVEVQQITSVNRHLREERFVFAVSITSLWAVVTLALLHIYGII